MYIAKNHASERFIFLSLFFLAARRILVPWPGIEPGPSAVQAPSPNRWTAREFPRFISQWSSAILLPILHFSPQP